MPQADTPPEISRYAGSLQDQDEKGSLPTRHAAGSSLHQRGNPAPRGRAISVPLDPVTSGSPRSPPGTSPARSGRIEARIVQLPKLIVTTLQVMRQVQKSAWCVTLCMRDLNSLQLLHNLKARLRRPAVRPPGRTGSIAEGCNTHMLDGRSNRIVTVNRIPRPVVIVT